MKLASLVLAVVAAFASTPVCANGADDEANWKATRGHLAQSLAASSNPRDWLLSAALFAEPRSAEAAATLAKAVAAAPDDALVQWVAATAGNESATTALTRLEPDNGASWLPMLRSAIERDDESGIDAALSGFSASARFDDHYGQLLHAWQDALRAEPDAPICDGDEKHCNRTEREFSLAMALTAASVFPATQPILNFCKATAADSPHRRQCETGARNMFRNSQTMVSSAVGFALLRDLDALTPADKELRRQREWLSKVTMPIHRNFVPGNAAYAAFLADWTTLDSEFEVMRRLAQRNGQPLLPPDGWVSPGQHAREASKARGER